MSWNRFPHATPVPFVYLMILKKNTDCAKIFFSHKSPFILAMHRFDTKIMKWFIRTSTEKTIELDVELSDTIGDVKLKIQLLKGIAVRQQCLTCAGKILEDACMLNDISCDLANDNVHLVLKFSEVAVSVENFQQH